MAARKKTSRPGPKEPHLEAELDELYGRPLQEFTSARDELVKRLRRSGDRAAAAKVGALKKPSVSVWAVNQGARADKNAATRLIKAGAQLESAQAAAMRGSGRAGLRDAMAAEQEAVEAIADHAEAALATAGRANAATLDRVRKTLRAVAGDSELGRELAAGRVTRDHEAVGFAAASTVARPKRRSDSAAARKRSQAAERAAKQARARLDAASKQVAQAERALGRAQAALDDAREVLQAAEIERKQRENELTAVKRER